MGLITAPRRLNLLSPHHFQSDLTQSHNALLYTESETAANATLFTYQAPIFAPGESVNPSKPNAEFDAS